MSLYDRIQAAAKRAFAAAREAWDVSESEIRFEDTTKTVIVALSGGKDWRPKKTISAVDGSPQIEVSILFDQGVTEAQLRNTRFAVLKGQRYEKIAGSYEHRKDPPERHQLRFDAIGEVA